MHTHAKQIDLNGHVFQYRETGRSSAPPVVAIHGLGDDARSWDTVAQALGDTYRVLALDQRGHGGSARPGNYSFELMCEDLRQFADALALDQFILLAHSMGGTVAYLFAESYPTRLTCMVLEDTPAPIVYRQWVVPPKPAEAVPFDWEIIPSLFAQCNTPKPEWWHAIGTIVTPTLIIGGGSTSSVPQELLREVAHIMPRCELVTIEGAGHHVHKSNPFQYIQAVRAFLGA